MTNNQARAVRLAEALLEDPDYLGVFEMFEDDNLTEEDVNEILANMQQVSICFPDSWHDA